MSKTIFLMFCVLGVHTLFSQTEIKPPQIKVMTLGVFHFDYPNLDVIKTEEEDKISILDEPFQSEIIAICNTIMEFQPTIIAVELTPKKQSYIDSLYSLFKSDKWKLTRNEVFQLGFRIGKKLNINKIYCVDDPGRHYENLITIFNDSTRLANLEYYYFNNQDSIYSLPVNREKITSIIDALYESNNPERIRERLSSYLFHPFKYEEEPGDFTGVDFESGRWYNRNLRIFRNIQRIPQNKDDRILLIIGNEHLNLLNLFFDISREYELVSPLQYLEKAKK